MDEVQEGIYSSDIALGCLYTYEFRSFIPALEISEYLWQDDECLLAGLPPPVKKRDTLIQPFDSIVWICSIASVAGTIMLAFGYTKSLGDEAPISYGAWLSHIFATFFQEPHLSVTELKSDKVRIFMTIFMSMTFILTSAYAGILKSFLSIPPKPPTLKTLQEVAESSTPLVQHEGFIDTSPLLSEDKQKIVKRTTGHMAPPSLIGQVIEEKIILFGSKDLMQYHIGEDLFR